MSTLRRTLIAALLVFTAGLTVYGASLGGLNVGWLFAQSGEADRCAENTDILVDSSRDVYVDSDPNCYGISFQITLVEDGNVIFSETGVGGSNVYVGNVGSGTNPDEAYAAYGGLSVTVNLTVESEPYVFEGGIMILGHTNGQSGTVGSPEPADWQETPPATTPDYDSSGDPGRYRDRNQVTVWETQVFETGTTLDTTVTSHLFFYRQQNGQMSLTFSVYRVDSSNNATQLGTTTVTVGTQNQSGPQYLMQESFSINQSFSAGDRIRITATSNRDHDMLYGSDEHNSYIDFGGSSMSSMSVPEPEDDLELLDNEETEGPETSLDNETTEDSTESETSPENTEDTTEPENTDDITEPENTDDITEPENIDDITEPENTEQEETEPV